MMLKDVAIGYGEKYVAIQEHMDLVRKLAEAGNSDRFMADFFGVSESMWQYWRANHKEFSEALKLWKKNADERVVKSVYLSATGYELEEEKVFVSKDGVVTRAKIKKKYAPSDKAAIFWLKNRQRDEWKDSFSNEVESKNINTNTHYINAVELEDRLELLEDKEGDTLESYLQ